MVRIEKGRAFILCALLCTVIIAIIGIKDAKNINAETPEDTANKQFKEITIVTVTPKKVEAQEYIDFDLRNLSIVRKEGEEDDINDSGTSSDGESATVAEDSGRNEPDTYDDTADDSADERSTGETDGSEMAESGQEQWSESEDIVSEDGDGESMPKLVESESSDEAGSEGSVDSGYTEQEFRNDTDTDNEDGESNGEGDGYTDESDAEAGLTYLGTYIATAYCSCEICTGIYSSGYTASGTLATEGRTVACNSLPFGTQLMIDGHIYTVEDTGWSPYGDAWLDFFFESHDSALAFGVREVEVYMVN